MPHAWMHHWQAFAADTVKAGADAPTWQFATVKQNIGRACMTKTEQILMQTFACASAALFSCESEMHKIHLHDTSFQNT